MGKQKGRKRKGGDPAALFWMAVALGSARMPMLQQYAAVVVGVSRPVERVRDEFRRMPPRCPPGASCFACGRPPQHRHHIIQIQHGGLNDPTNIVWLCRGCHERIHPWMVEPLVPLSYEQYRPPWWPASAAK